MSLQWRQWTSDRFGWDLIRRHVLERRLVKGRWYQGDGAALLALIGVQVLTGAVMLLTYAPTSEAAYQSVRHISEQQPLGWMLRGLHYWSAGFTVVLLGVHLFRQLLLGGYKAPREGTWLLGVILLFAVLAMSYTGYLLRWDERAIYGLRVGLHMLHNVPWIGGHLVLLVQGGPEIGTPTLTRIFAIHVLWIPLLMGLLIAWHLYLVMRHGVTTVAERREPVQSAEQQRELYERERQSEQLGGRMHPTVSFESGVYAMLVLLAPLALTLAIGPPSLYPPANLTQRSFPVEEWWFWWYSGLIALLPPWLAPTFVVVFPIAVLVLLLLLPFVDRSPHRGMRRRPIAVALTAATILALLVLTEYRRQSPWTAWPTDAVAPVPEGEVLSPAADAGRRLFSMHGCNTCHAVAGHGRRFGPDLATIDPPMSAAELRDYILDPPADVAMPAYEHRITEADVDAIVDYVLAAQTFALEGREDGSEDGSEGDGGHEASRSGEVVE